MDMNILACSSLKSKRPSLVGNGHDLNHTAELAPHRFLGSHATAKSDQGMRPWKGSTSVPLMVWSHRGMGRIRIWMEKEHRDTPAEHSSNT